MGRDEDRRLKAHVVREEVPGMSCGAERECRASRRCEAADSKHLVHARAVLSCASPHAPVRVMSQGRCGKFADIGCPASYPKRLPAMPQHVGGARYLRHVSYLSR